MMIDKREKYQARGLGTSDRNSKAVKNADVVLLAIKPQVLEDVLESISDVIREDALVISVVAGATIECSLTCLHCQAQYADCSCVSWLLLCSNARQAWRCQPRHSDHAQHAGHDRRGHDRVVTVVRCHGGAACAGAIVSR